MLRLFRLPSKARALPLVLAMGGLWSVRLRGEVIDYAASGVLSETKIDVAVIAARAVSLGEFMAFVEAETGLPFSYPPGVLPLSAEITIKSPGRISLAGLFTIASAQTNVGFEHGGDKILARLLRPEPSGAPAQPVAPTSASPTVTGTPRLAAFPPSLPAIASPTVPAAATPAIADEVRAIVAKTTHSHDKKEKAIVAAVRTAALTAIGLQPRPAGIVSAAADIAEAAAQAGPAFADAIARAVGFIPAVKNISGGPGQVRAAAYNGARGAKVSFAAPAPAAMGRSAEQNEVPAGSASVPLTAAYTSTFASEPRRTETYTADSQSSPAPAASGNGPSIGGVAIPAPVVPAATEAGADGVLRMEKFSVADTVVKGSTSDLRSERAKASVSIDYMSADQLLKFSAGDLSEVVFRIPGVSVAQGQFAVVRGLSDRFLSTTLQGVKLPTPDPEKQAVQLDLVPASAVEAVVVSKTYQSSMWAESSGGNMDVRTRAIPSEGQLKLSLAFKVNSNAADGGPDYANAGGKNERLGFGSRSRLAFGTGDPAWPYVPTHRSSFPIGNKVSMEFARAFNFGDQQLGVLVSAFSEAGSKAKTGTKQALGAQAGRAPRAAVPATGTRPAVAADPGRPSDFETGLPTAPYARYDYEESEKENVLSATTAIGYRFSADHEVKLTGLFVQSGIDLAQISGTTVVTDPTTKLPVPVSGLGGFTGAEDYAWFKTYEYFRERNLGVLQLSGRHHLAAFGDLRVNWSAQKGSSYEKQSPFIEANFATPLTNLNKSFVALGGSDAPQTLKALWADNKESQKTARFDVDWPVRLWSNQESTVSFGAALDKTDRETSGSAIDYRQNSGGTVTAASPNLVFARVVGRQTGIATPPTTAAREVRAYYAGTNIALFESLKLVAGARYEDFSLATTGSGRWGGNLTSASFYSVDPARTILGAAPAANPPFSSQKWYPGMGLIYTPEKSLTARLHYSKTTGRPSLREVSPFFNKSIETDNLVTGNPALTPSDVTNYDLRVEWSPSRTNFFAVSVFRKEIERPIEKIVFSQTVPAVGENTESWMNNPGKALVRGLEFEFRHQFKSWSEALRDFSLSGNFTRLDATVPEVPFVVRNLLGTYQDAARIPTTRRLFDQPEYIANLDLTWARPNWGTSATLAAFAISDVLTATGKPTFFDIYERATTRLDFVFNQQISSRLKLRLSVKNLADPARGLIYDREATTALVERNTYHAGRDYGVSVTYDF